MNERDLERAKLIDKIQAARLALGMAQRHVGRVGPVGQPTVDAAIRALSYAEGDLAEFDRVSAVRR